jgi:TonB family protein
VIHFDFNERYRDEDVVGTAISRREGVLLSVIFHGLVAAAFIIGPTLSIFQPSPEELERRQAELERQRELAQQRLVFVQPLSDVPALKPPEEAPLSDLDRRAQAPQIAPKPEAPVPFSRGNSPEPVEAAEARGVDEPKPPQPEPESQIARVLPNADEGVRRPPETPSTRLRGSLGDALRNLQRYVENQNFNSPQGGSEPGSSLQFDSKGADFGSWVRRWRAQVYRNWLLPQAAMVMHGHVSIRFTVHRNGEVTDIAIVQPSTVDAFNRAAYGAIYSSNPTPALPADYPLDTLDITATFYYNEEIPF